MRRRRRSSRRHSRGRRRSTPSVAIAGYTRPISLTGATGASGATSLITASVPDVVTPPSETVNRKILRVGGQAFFAAGLAAGQTVMAQFCLWAHPKHEVWPPVSDYDPFTEGPGESSFEGMLSPRPFCRRTFVLAAPSSGVAETISSQHMIRSKAERLLRPGWVLHSGLYIRGSTSGIQVSHQSLLRVVVAG